MMEGCRNTSQSFSEARLSRHQLAKVTTEDERIGTVNRSGLLIRVRGKCCFLKGDN